MRVVFSNSAIESLKDAPPTVRRAFAKQLRFPVNNIQHPSLHAKKYDEARDLWQARASRGWPFRKPGEKTGLRPRGATPLGLRW